MNRRNFLLACAGLTATPVLASMPYPKENLILATMKEMPIGGSITITKISESDWRIYGDIGERIK